MKPGMGWPIGVTVILGATIAVNLWVMKIANSDPSFAIEPDYYRKAVHYDSTMAQQRLNASLGWGVEAARRFVAVLSTIIGNDIFLNPGSFRNLTQRRSTKR